MIPFTPLSANPVSLTADVKLKQSGLQFEFLLLDPQDTVAPTPLSTFQTRPGKRLDELWKTTCFEVFWREPGRSNYWEFNVGAHGDWNIYEFTDYRLPQPPLPSNDFSLLRLETHALGLRGEIQGPFGQKIELSVCAVLPIHQQVQYFSHQHAGAKPDFHHRQSFTIIRGLS